MSGRGQPGVATGVALDTLQSLDGGPAGPSRSCDGCGQPIAGDVMSACSSCRTINPAQVGPSANPRAMGQSLENVESMIYRVLAGEQAPSVVESVMGETDHE